jgi:hypothetical protein
MQHVNPKYLKLAYPKSKFLPRKPYSRAGWRNKERTLYRVTFSDGFVARAYGLRDIGKPGNSGSVDIGRPARAAVEKYRLHLFPEIGMAAYMEPVPEIVELRSLDDDGTFDPSLANAGTADMRGGTWG